MTLVVRSASRDEPDLATIAGLIAVSSPEHPTSIEEMRWADATYPGTERFIAELDGQEVGAATVGRIYVHPSEFDGSWATIDVRPEARGRGVGRALLAAAESAARRAGKSYLHVPTSAARPEAIAFLERRGFVVHERDKAVRLDLAGWSAPVAPSPVGVDLTDLAARPDLVSGVHAVAIEAFTDIPGGSEPMSVGDLAEFRARDVDAPGIDPAAFAIAVERSSDRVVGYAVLTHKPGAPGVAIHDMTAVLRDWRGRGLATALKVRLLDWAVANSLTALETGNDEANLAMREVNRRLGYRPLPDRLTMRGRVSRA